MQKSATSLSSYGQTRIKQSTSRNNLDLRPLKSLCMSVMRVVVLHLYTSLKLVGLPVPKVWLIFCHGVKQTGDLDL